MRILKLDEREKAKLKQRETEIQEGLRLARKIDELRKLANEEEDRYRKAADAYKKTIQEEIAGLIATRDKLLIEINESKTRSTDKKDESQAQ